MILLRLSSFALLSFLACAIAEVDLTVLSSSLPALEGHPLKLRPFVPGSLLISPQDKPTASSAIVHVCPLCSIELLSCVAMEEHTCSCLHLHNLEHFLMQANQDPLELIARYPISLALFSFFDIQFRSFAWCLLAHILVIAAPIARIAPQSLQLFAARNIVPLPSTL